MDDIDGRYFVAFVAAVVLFWTSIGYAVWRHFG